MKTALKIVAGILLLLAVIVGGTLAWAFSAADAKRAPHRFDDVQGKDIPVPWPLSEAEIAELRAQKAAEMAAVAAAPTGTAPTEGAAAPTGEAPAAGEGAEGAQPAADPLAGVDLQAIAMQRALDRGHHLLDSRLGCTDCHSADFSGSTVVDVPVMGRWVCPNITQGGTTKGWKPADYERVIRQGVGHDGRGLTMPSNDFSMLSDQEVSDVIAVVTSMPPVTKEQPPIKLGPIYAMLIATGKVPIDADTIDHKAERPALPPTSAPNAEFGKHLAQVCQGCHARDLAGGPIVGGDPAWPPARNLTPDATGLQGWTLDDFKKALREGKRKDGTPIDPVMPYAMTKNMTDDEVGALWAYLQTVPAKPWPGKG